MLFPKKLEKRSSAVDGVRIQHFLYFLYRSYMLFLTDLFFYKKTAQYMYKKC